ncbi:uncharacterized protein (TIGR00369 family) [Desulfitispora alkaliphila]|uniref:PaaI family thioesterase n=1 Tax=Desulfitispora alkaliphila TaxID=622674 RepID=UPI003D1ED81D
MLLFREPENKGLHPRLFGTLVNVNEDCPFQNFLDIYVVALGEKYALMETPLEGDHMDHEGNVHCGVVNSLAETAMSMAVRTANHKGRLKELKMAMVDTTKFGETLRAESTVDEIGEDILVQVSISTVKGRKIATGTGVYSILGEFLPPAKDGLF